MEQSSNRIAPQFLCALVPLSLCASGYVSISILVAAKQDRAERCVKLEVLLPDRGLTPAPVLN